MAMYASSPTRGPEYIDSWLLSGHCAQQAMLTINFSDISERLDSGLATSADQRAVRTWAIISLVHLHWAAITGRPPTIPAAYLLQSQLLLNFEQATMRDGMLVAETFQLLAFCV
uniref:Transcription factor domain-containing protein n=1 Tax=Bionectria ochroleuca TaxID=29856 RepID=A0A0B7JJ77_BIOOC